MPDLDYLIWVGFEGGLVCLTRGVSMKIPLRELELEQRCGSLWADPTWVSPGGQQESKEASDGISESQRGTLDVREKF